MGMDDRGGLDVEDLMREAQTSDPETRAQLLALIDDYRGVQQRLNVPGGKAAMAFTDLRANNFFWPIKHYNCRY